MKSNSNLKLNSYRQLHKLCIFSIFKIKNNRTILLYFCEYGVILHLNY